MEFIPGKSLRGLMDELPPGRLLPLMKILHIFDELCAALDYAHAYTVHRDIKPENVMIPTGGGLKLMDFGISKLMNNSNMTATSMVMGTPHYMSPEQLRNSASVDARADIYSVGVMLYELVTGRTPEIVPKAASEISRGVPLTLDPIIAKCLENDPDKRYKTAAELREALSEVADAVKKQTTAQVQKERASFRRRSTAQRMAIIALIALLGAGFAAGLAKVESDRRSLLAAVAGADTQIPTQPPDPTTTPQQETFNYLGALVERAHGIALLRQNTEFDEITSQGKSAWETAQQEFDADTEEGIRLGWNALNLLVAAAVAPPGMAFIPRGEVTIQPNSNPVDTPAFLIEVNEVTSGDYAEFVQTKNWRPHKGATTPDEPVTNVSFYDAQAYAASKNLRLPTEAQWARAAYGNSETPTQFPWGDEWDQEATNVGGVGRPKPVGSHEQDLTNFGCYDMYGNVREWTRTLARPSTSPSDTPPVFGSFLRVRGSFYSDPSQAQDGMLRATEYPYSSRNSEVGFRCVFELPASLPETDALLSRADPDA
jgi:formylglycine-generating enzyme required for sulfatase activity